MFKNKFKVFIISLSVLLLLSFLLIGFLISYVNIQSTIDPSFSSACSIVRDGLNLDITLLGSRWTVDLSPVNSALGFLNQFPFLIPSSVRLIGQGVTWLTSLF